MHTAPLKESTVKEPPDPAVRKRLERIETFGPLKRILDIFSSLLSLVIAGPLLCCFATRGLFGRQVLTRTERVGLYGKPFIQYGLSGISQDRFLHDLPVLLNILSPGKRCHLLVRWPASPGVPVLKAVGRAKAICEARPDLLLVAAQTGQY